MVPVEVCPKISMETVRVNRQEGEKFVCNLCIGLGTYNGTQPFCPITYSLTGVLGRYDSAFCLWSQVLRYTIYGSISIIVHDLRDPPPSLIQPEVLSTNLYTELRVISSLLKGLVRGPVKY